MSNCLARNEDMVGQVKKALRCSLQALQQACACPDSQELERLAYLVYDSMSTSNRLYHSVKHALELIEHMTYEEQPIPVLAALFHDLIYLSVDKCILPVQETLIGDLVCVHNQPNGTMTYHVSLPPRDTWDGALHMVDAIFGGLKTDKGCNVNEYLSALAAVRGLYQTLRESKHLLALVACIEASVPFRPTQPDGKTPMDFLFQRLKKYVSLHGTVLHGLACRLSDGELVAIVQQAAFFANCDLGCFSSRDFYFFLDTSWKLLPEWWPPLCEPQHHIQDIFRALVILSSRYQSTPVDALFQSFSDVPSSGIIADKRQVARHNIQTAREYTLVRLMGVGTVIDALQSTLPSLERKVQDMGGGAVFWNRFNSACWKMIHILTTVSSGQESEEESDGGLKMLVQGRRTSYAWDAALSPWAIYICDQWGFQTVVKLSAALVSESDDAKGWVDALPLPLVETLVRILQAIFPEDACSLETIVRRR